MKCHYHPDLDSVNSCSVCSRFLCASCAHSVKGRIYCQDCLVQGAELAALARSPRFANYSPSRAALFGLIPGIGAVYNRQYAKAIAHVGIFSALWIMADAGPAVFALAAVAFWIFSIIDAYRSAEAILRQGITQPLSPLQEEKEEIRLPLWGGALVLLGMLFFFSNLGVFSLRAATRFAWPLLFVAAGLYLILYYFFYQSSRPASSAAAGAGPSPAAPPERAPAAVQAEPVEEQTEAEEPEKDSPS